jgi:hypothetical protein
VTTAELSDIALLRAALVRVARAHARCSQTAVAALPPGNGPALPWLLDAHRGATMAALYGETLAAVLGVIEDHGPPELAEMAHDQALLMLENGAEDENADVAPA